MEKKNKDMRFAIAILSDDESDNPIDVKYFRQFDRDNILWDKIEGYIPDTAILLNVFRSNAPIYEYFREDDLMENAGFTIWQTGGGCTAYGMHIDSDIDPDEDGNHYGVDVMVTSVHGSTHKNEGDGYDIGHGY